MRRETSVRRVDGVGNAGWGILLFELVKDCGCPRFVSARTGEVVKVAIKARLSLSTRARANTAQARKNAQETSGLDTLADMRAQ